MHIAGISGGPCRFDDFLPVSIKLQLCKQSRGELLQLIGTAALVEHLLEERVPVHWLKILQEPVKEALSQPVLELSAALARRLFLPATPCLAIFAKGSQDFLDAELSGELALGTADAGKFFEIAQSLLAATEFRGELLNRVSPSDR